MKGNLLIVVLIIVIAGGLFFLVSDTPNDANEQEISVTENGESILEEAAEGLLPDGESDVYVVDSDATTLEWLAKRLLTPTHTGTITISEGRFIKEGDVFSGGEFTIDMTTITESENSERFLGHIRSDDFFGIEQFPTARFVITSTARIGNDVNVTGDLTIRDKTNEITFPATLSESGDTLTFNAELSIDRTRWDIIFDSSSFFQNLGDRAIRDTIDLTLNLVLNKN